MPRISIEGDGYIFNAHKVTVGTGVFERGSGSSRTFIRGIPILRVGDNSKETDGKCGGGTGTIVTGSSQVFESGIPVALIGKSNVNCHEGTIIDIQYTGGDVDAKK